MRHGTWVAIAALFVTAPAAAQDEDEGEAKQGADKAGAGPQGSLDTSEDPAETEKVERGPFSPTGGTGKLKAEKEAQQDDEQAETRRATRKRVQIFGEGVIGWGRAPAPGIGNARTTGEGFGVVLVAGGSYDISPKLSLGLRVPWTTADFDTALVGTGRTGGSSQALGVPELLLEYRVSLGPRMDLPIGLGIGIPVAQGNPDVGSTDTAGQEQWAALLFADAVTGWRDGELFMPKRLPIVPSVGIVYEGTKLEARGYTKLVVAPNLGGEISEQRVPEIGTFEVPGTALRSVTGGGVAYWFLDSPRLSGGLDAWAVLNAVEGVEFESASGAAGPSIFQFVIEPRVAAVFGPVRPSLGYILPVGGRLSDAGAQGVRLRVDVGF